MLFVNVLRELIFTFSLDLYISFVLQTCISNCGLANKLFNFFDINEAHRKSLLDNTKYMRFMEMLYRQIFFKNDFKI